MKYEERRMKYEERRTKGNPQISQKVLTQRRKGAKWPREMLSSIMGSTQNLPEVERKPPGGSGKERIMKNFEGVRIWGEGYDLIYCIAENPTQAQQVLNFFYHGDEIIFLHEIHWEVEKGWKETGIELRWEALERFIEDEADRYECHEQYLVDNHRDPRPAFDLQEAVERVWRFLREGDPEPK